MEIDKSQIIEMLKSQGDNDKASQADSQLPDKVDPEQHSDLLGKLGINPQDLIGKKVAVPFVSTGHYSLLAALKHWNIDPSKVTILNLAPPAIIAATAG